MSEPDKPGSTNRAWEELQQTGERIGGQIEAEVRRAVRFLDEEVVPEVRRSGSAALRTAAEQLRKLAEQLDDERKRREGGGS